MPESTLLDSITQAVALLRKYPADKITAHVSDTLTEVDSDLWRAIDYLEELELNNWQNV